MSLVTLLAPPDDLRGCRVISTPVVLPDGFTFDALTFNPGQARRLLFLHGLGGRPQMMLVLRYLALRHRLTIIAPTMPCHGHTHDVATFSELVDRVAEFMVEQGLIDTPVIGHSLGAVTTLYLASAHPELVSAGICLAMPTRQPASELDLVARLSLVMLSGVTTTIGALVRPGYTGGRAHLLRGIVDMATTGMRLPALLRLLAYTVPDPADAVASLTVPIYRLEGNFDLAFGKPVQDPGLNPASKVPHGHCFPLVARTWQTIGSLVGEVLGGEAVLPTFALPVQRVTA